MFEYEHTTTVDKPAGVYCARCGRKMYRDSNGRWRCPWCDDYVDNPTVTRM